MLVGIGVSAPAQKKDQNGDVDTRAAIEVGPKTVLFAPMSADGKMGDWKYIAPDAAAIGEIRQNVEGVTTDFRRLAMQPMVQKAGNITATATSVDASKAHSAVESWATVYQDRLNQALKYVAVFYGSSDTTTAAVHTDFAGDASGVEEGKVLADAQKRQVISKKVERQELQRRNILGPDYRSEDDKIQIADETQGLEPEEDIDPANGDVIPLRAAS
jgi:hypothetical protein